MRALTVRQPWAWAIASGVKTIENRTWTTTYRGPLAIHAGARWDGSDAHQTVSDLANVHVSEMRITGKQMGAVIAVVDLTGICDALVRDQTCDCGPWAMGEQYHWQLASPRPIDPPAPSKGRLGLWIWESSR